MKSFVLFLVLLLGAAAPTAAQRDTLRIGVPGDTLGGVRGLPTGPSITRGDTVFDTRATAALVDRVIRAGSTVPEGLRDYRAGMRSAVFLAVRADTAPGGEQPVTVDEFTGEVRWDRGGGLLQRITGHRVRLLAPTPYTIGTLLESPWVIPHLYGNTIDVFQFSSTSRTRRLARAIHPFSFRGADFYRYVAGDTVRVRTREGTTTLVPVEVRARPGTTPGDTRLVAGTFWVDVDRAAVARARFGFVERGTEGLVRLSDTGLFFELESGLVEGRYWLPFRQRREIQITSPLFGGAAAIRLVTSLSGFDLNTGWTPEQPGRARLAWDLERDAFRGWRGLPGEEDEGFDIADFADLAEATRFPEENPAPLRVALRYQRGEHLFRYNRVEGPYLGLGVVVEPRDPDARRWDLYATAGWAMAEGEPRGEASGRWRLTADPQPGEATWTAQAAGYRRLRETQAFRPLVQWELGHSVNALLGGFDVRDYYDATGAEAALIRRREAWTASVGGRWERQDRVTRNTTTYLFGTAEDENFPPVAPAEPGNHAAVEGELRFARGPGSFGIGNSLAAALRADAGLADFRFTRVTALLSTRRDARLWGVRLRLDGGHLGGDPPPQFLFRFGGTEGLRGYQRNEFGGTTAAIARTRLLLYLPPYGSEPLFRVGFFAFPPLRPALVASGEAGWARVADGSRLELLRLGGARPTSGTEASVGAGVSFFEDAVSAEYVRPAGGGDGRWYVGFVQGF